MRKVKEGMLPLCAILWLAGHHAHLHGEINRYLPYDIPEGVTERDFAVSYITGKEGIGKDWGDMSEEERILFRRKEDRFNGLPPGVLFAAYKEVLSADKDNPGTVKHIVTKLSLLGSLGNDVLFPFYYDLLSANAEKPEIVAHIVGAFCARDSDNLASCGEPEVLRLLRESVARGETAYLNTLMYLAFKGKGEDDIKALENAKAHDEETEFCRQELADVLKERMEANYITRGSRRVMYGERGTCPSVANAGPQGVYAYHIIWKAYEMEGGNALKIPEDLAKMVITFDADGNPVSSVDLAKHGLSMPVITPKPTANDRITFDNVRNLDVVFPHEQGEGWAPPPPVKPEAPATAGAARQPALDTKPPPPEHPAVPPSGKPLLWLAALAIAALAVAVIWKRKR